MPELSRFFGIVIAMYYRDHNPPHFHAYYGADEIAVSIREGRILWGSFPNGPLKHVLEWLSAHRAELEEDWQRARNRQPLTPIPPLES